MNLYSICKDDSDFLGSGDHIQSDRDTILDSYDNHDDEPMLDNSDMDFLGKSGSAKADIKFLPDLFNGVGQLQETVNTELSDMNFLGSDNHIKNDNDSPHKCETLVAVNTFLMILMKAIATINMNVISLLVVTQQWYN